VSLTFFDMDTQIDFMYPAGSLYVPGAEKIVPAIARLNNYAAAKGLPLVSDMCAHTENDEEFREWPPHCVVGTAGQLKPQATMVQGRRVTIPVERGQYAIEGAAQILFEKRKLDIFSNPNLPELLDRLGASEYVVYGVVTELCVRLCALGLLGTGKRVTMVTDAIQALSPADRDRTFEEFAARGGRLATVADICGS
jgi:nicotinamidase/pyrazinamidase